MVSDVTRAEVVKAAMERWCKAPVKWGHDDCMMAVADIVKRITGKDPARRFRGQYKSKRAAIRVLGRGGTLKQAKVSASACHWKPVDPAQARPGDVGLVAIKVKKKNDKMFDDFSAVVCLSPGWFVARGLRGFVGLASDKIAMAWSVR